MYQGLRRPRPSHVRVLFLQKSIRDCKHVCVCGVDVCAVLQVSRIQAGSLLFYLGDYGIGKCFFF